MPWVATKNMRLGDYQARRGVPLPDHVIAAIPILRWGSLVRTELVKEVELAQLGELCPICGEGPFTRLARHMTAVHDDELLAEEAKLAAEVEAVDSAEEE